MSFPSKELKWDSHWVAGSERILLVSSIIQGTICQKKFRKLQIQSAKMSSEARNLGCVGCGRWSALKERNKDKSDVGARPGRTGKKAGFSCSRSSVDEQTCCTPCSSVIEDCIPLVGLGQSREREREREKEKQTIAEDDGDKALW